MSGTPGILLPRGVYGWLSAIVGTLSLIALLHQGLAVGLSSAAASVLDAYESATRALFGYVEPYLLEQLAAFRDWIGDISLSPHWKHVFVLMIVYVGADARTSIGFGNAGSAAFRVLWGGTIALIASAAAGAIAVDPTDFISNFLVAFVPILGLTTYDVGEVAWQTVWFPSRNGEHPSSRLGTRALDVVLRFLASVSLVLIGLQFEFVRQLPNPGLALLSAVVVLFAIWWLVWGARYANHSRKDGESWWEGFSRRGGTRVGAAMFRIFIGALGFFAIDAGWQLFQRM